MIRRTERFRKKGGPLGGGNPSRVRSSRRGGGSIGTDDDVSGVPLDAPVARCPGVRRPALRRARGADRRVQLRAAREFAWDVRLRWAFFPNILYFNLLENRFETFKKVLQVTL